jgi:hypothetical protein
MCAGRIESLPEPSTVFLRMLKGMMTFSRALALASIPALEPPRDYTFLLGHIPYLEPDDCDSPVHTDSPAFFRPATDGHLLLTGKPGSGKTVLVRDLATQVIPFMDVHLYDSWYSLNPQPGDEPPEGLASFSKDLTECAAALRGVRDEVRRRVRLCAETGGSFEDLGLRRILIILDDSHHLVTDEFNTGDLNPMGRQAEAQGRKSCLEDIAEIAASARAGGVTFVFSSEWAPADSPIPAEVLESGVTRLALVRYGAHWDLQDLTDRQIERPRFGDFTRPGFDETRIVIDPRTPPPGMLQAPRLTDRAGRGDTDPT